MNTHLIAAIILASISVANADPIPVKYVRMQGNTESEKVFQGHARDKPTPGISVPFAGKLLSALSPVQRITVWHNYPEQVSDEVVRQKLPHTDFIWILEHYSMRAACQQDYINIPAGTMIDIHYKNRFVLRVNTLEKTAYEGSLISPTGKYESVGFRYHGDK
jgi:hypothetical protein